MASALLVIVGVAIVGVGTTDLSLPGTSNGIDDDVVTLPTDAPRDTPTPARSGEVACTHAGAPTNCLAWEVDTGRDISLGPRLPGAGVLVTADDDALVVRDPATGEVLWQREDLGGARPHAVVDGVMVMSTVERVGVGVDVRDGTDLWTRRGLRAVGPASGLDAGVVVLGRQSGDRRTISALVGLEPTTGTERWSWTVPWSTGVGTTVQPSGSGGLLVAGSGRLAHLDTGTGEPRWVVDTVDDAYLQPQGTEHVSAAQIGTAARPELWIHDVATGEVVLRTSATRVASHLVVDGVLVVHAPSEGVVRGMDLDTGDQRWQVLLDGPGGLGYPLTADESGAVVLLERDARRVRRLAPRTGETRWQARLGASPARSGSGTFFGQPMLVDDLVVVEDTSSVITVLDVATGSELVRVVGGPALDVRSLAPLTLVEGTRWMGIAVPAPAP